MRCSQLPNVLQDKDGSSEGTVQGIEESVYKVMEENCLLMEKLSLHFWVLKGKWRRMDTVPKRPKL